MKFQFSAIETNNAKIEELTQQIEVLKADNIRMGNIQAKAMTAIAQLSEVFSEMVGAGIDETSMKEFRSVVISTVGADTNTAEVDSIKEKLQLSRAKVVRQQQDIAQLNQKIGFYEEELAATRQERDNYQSMWNTCINEPISMSREEEILDVIATPTDETSIESPQKPDVELLAPATATSDELLLIQPTTLDTEASQPVNEVINVQPTAVEEDEEVYSLNARPGNVFRTEEYPQVMMLARHSKQWLGKIMETGELVKFNPSDIVSFKYTSAHRAERVKLDKNDPNNYFAVGDKVQSGFSSHEYKVVSSNPVETVVVSNGKETMFLTSDLMKVEPATVTVTLTEREKEIIADTQAAIAEDKPKKDSKIASDWRARLKNKKDVA